MKDKLKQFKIVQIINDVNVLVGYDYKKNIIEDYSNLDLIRM